VNFEDIFCSAKLDTCNAAGDASSTADDVPIRLLFGDDDVRDDTAVVAVACAGGTGVQGATRLHMSHYEIARDEGTLEIDPTLGPGTMWRPASTILTTIAVDLAGQAVQLTAGGVTSAPFRLPPGATLGDSCCLASCCESPRLEVPRQRPSKRPQG